jgi:hypothetical protein
MKATHTLLGMTLVAACATNPPPAAPETQTTTITSADMPAETARNVQILPEPDYTARETANAEAVLGTMHEDLLACYKKRLAANPAAHGYITVDIVIGPDGRVRTTETTGGAILGDATMRCIVQRIERATFEPPHGGGTLRVQVPFSLDRLAAD